MKRTNYIILAAMLAVTLSSCNTAEETASSETAALTASEASAADTLSETVTSETTESETTTLTASETTKSETSAETILSETTETAEEKACVCPTEWQHAYSEYINSLDFLAGGVYLGDINGDDIPEAVIEINPFEMTEILYFNADGMQKLELSTTSVWGSVRYIPDTKQILLMPMRGHTQGTWGYEEYFLYSWNGSDFEVTSTINRESGMYFIDEDGIEHSEFGQAYIDGVAVDNDTFEPKLAEFEKLETENSYFPVAYINDSNEKPNPDPDSVKEYIKTNFPCFDNWDILQF